MSNAETSCVVGRCRVRLPDDPALFSLRCADRSKHACVAAAPGWVQLVEAHLYVPQTLPEPLATCEPLLENACARMFTARDALVRPDVSPDVLAQYANSDSPQVRQWAAGHSHLPDPLVAQLLGDRFFGVRAVVISQHVRRFDESQWRAALSDRHPLVRALCARQAARWLPAQDPDLLEEALELWAADEVPAVRREAARYADRPEQLRALLSDPDPIVRQAAAQRIGLPADAFEQALSDPAERVWTSALSNPACPPELVVQAASVDPPDARAAFARMILRRQQHQPIPGMPRARR